MTASDWLAFVRSLGITAKRSPRFGLRMRYADWDALPLDVRTFAHRNERAILDALRLEAQPSVVAPSVATPTPATPTTFRGSPITEADIRACLAAVGDDALTRYDSGALPRHEACAMTREFLRLCYSPTAHSN
jgi:hypothetical protein